MDPGHKQQLQVIRENYLNPLATATLTSRRLSLLVVGLAAALVISIGIIYNLTARDPLIVKINDNGIPEPLIRVKDKTLADLTNYKVFISSFLDHIYNWNSITYKTQIKLAVPMMAPDLRSEYLSQIESNEYVTAVEEGKQFSQISLQPIPDKVEQYKDGFLVQVEGIKTRVTSYTIDRTMPVRFHIGFRPCPLTSDNFWGFEVFELTEVRITEKPGGGRDQ